MRKLVLLMFILFALTGCSHYITLMARDGIEVGTGKVSGSWVHSDNLTIQLKRETYHGKWGYAASGRYGLLANYGMNVPKGAVIAVSGSRIGSALLISYSGKMLRCEFQDSEGAYSGVGVCQDNDGNLYDLAID